MQPVFNMVDPPRTQKALGLWQLTRHSPFKCPVSWLLREDEEVEALPVNLRDFWSGGDVSRWFARPCPMRPRHGFVESRPVTSRAEVLEVWRAARAVDPEAEMILMPLVEAEFNSILVVESGMLSIGPGHDGATGGRQSVAFPVVPMEVGWEEHDWYVFRGVAGIAPGEHTYIEAVYPRDRLEYPPRALAVQARSGPAQQVGARDYIPGEVKVGQVIEPTGDLLQWERLTASLAGKAGVVAWQQGATLACHAAVHCLAHGIPFLTGPERPALGQILRPTMAAAPPINGEDFRRGLAVAQVWPLDALRRAVPAAIAALHNAAYLSRSEHWGRLLGFTAGIIFRAGAIACCGELRHYQKKSGSTKSRQTVYARCAEMPLADLAASLRRRAPHFMHYGKWEKLFGGISWFRGSVEALALYRAIASEDYPKVLGQCNTVVHLSHNTGSFLNKFVEDSYLDLAAQRPTEVALHSAPVWHTAVCLPVGPIRARAYRLWANKWKVRIAVWNLTCQETETSRWTDDALRLWVNGVMWSPVLWFDETNRPLWAKMLEVL